jgi:hypothetical protein
MSRSLSCARTRRPTSLPPHKKWAPQQLLLLPSKEVMLKLGTRRTRKVGRRCGQLRRPDTLAGGSYGPEDVGVREGEGVGRPWPLRLEHAVSELPRPIVAGSSPSPWTAKNSARSCPAPPAEKARGVRRFSSTPTRRVLEGFLGPYRPKTGLPNSSQVF